MTPKESTSQEDTLSGNQRVCTTIHASPLLVIHYKSNSWSLDIYVVIGYRISENVGATGKLGVIPSNSFLSNQQTKPKIQFMITKHNTRHKTNSLHLGSWSFKV